MILRHTGQQLNRGGKFWFWNAMTSGGNLDSAMSEMDRTSITTHDTWCDVKLRCLETSPTAHHLWQMELWSVKTYVHLQVLQRFSINWQSVKKNINLIGHPSYVFSTERKVHIQKCIQPYQDRSSPVCQSHIARPGRNDTNFKFKFKSFIESRTNKSTWITKYNKGARDTHVKGIKRVQARPMGGGITQDCPRPPNKPTARKIPT